MLKNFSPQSLRINGRQSELIELALTYGFRSMDIDMSEMLRRSQRSSIDDAAKYLRAAENLSVGGFAVDVDLDADDDAFTSQVGALHPLTEVAAELGVSRAYIHAPAATDRLPYHEFFDTQLKRLDQIADVLGSKNIRLGVGFHAGTELSEGKEFAFTQNVEGFLALVKGVGNSNVGFLIDTWDWLVGAGTLEQISALTADQIVAVRMASLAPEVEAASATTNDRVLPEKEGGLDHVAVMKHLVSIDFEGPVSPSASPTQYKGQTRESTVQKSQKAIDGISADAGIEVSPLPMDLIDENAVETSVPAEA
ncbi:TIM barrel protein [Planctomycetes bacterium K23_9]|uniref:Xylose isomerase-like TIM barrel n=1 Tax=Stieleria marina TaxID=1930275 RepID=A0A517NZB0_9BACT|nr:Xylose isomerase-like TIM barrel [Planctomycetes bacterium K23_9]